ncbi:MAG: type II secretion system F family protein [Phycisphaerales bacterium]|nr:type II secretion system F family protein [Phycisphaerales bacterium]
MAIYRYIAITPTASGKPLHKRGEIAADSPYQVRATLRQMGLLPQRVDEVRRRPHAGLLRGRLTHMLRDRRTAAVAELFDGLGALLGSGVTLTDGLELLAGASRARASTLCRSLAERVRHGDGLAEALAPHADWFTPVDVAIIRAAEESGTLGETLCELAESLSHRDELRTRLATALAYPALLLVFGLGVVIFLTTVTLPQLAAVLADAQVALPRSTQVLLGFGRAITQHPFLVGTALALAVTSFVFLMRQPRFARIRLKAPVLGPASMRAQLAAASATLARLLRAGVGFAESIGLVTPTLGNAALRHAFEQLRKDLAAGRSISQSLATDGLFEPVFCRVIEVGEESGELPDTLARLAERYRATAKRSIDRLAAILEPAAILILAAGVGFVVYAAIAPMLRITQAL